MLIISLALVGKSLFLRLVIDTMVWFTLERPNIKQRKSNLAVPN